VKVNVDKFDKLAQFHLSIAVVKHQHGDADATILHITKGLEFKPDYRPLLELKQQVNAEIRKSDIRELPLYTCSMQ